MRWDTRAWSLDRTEPYLAHSGVFINLVRARAKDRRHHPHMGIDPLEKPISPFPDPVFEATDDPVSFQDALIYHMRRFGESYWQLYRAVVCLTV